MVKKLIKILMFPIDKIREEIRFRKKLKELKKRDPFIYK